jgi:hypothetical protein
MNIEKITWRDSGMHLDEHWQPVKALLSRWKYDDMIVHSAGMLAYEDDDVVGLSHSYSQTGDSHVGVMLIAKKNILTREVIDTTWDGLTTAPTAASRKSSMGFRIDQSKVEE